MSMASCSENSSGSDPIQRKRKRMESNRESARRSRMRKQKHVDDLTVEAGQLRIHNDHILSTITITSQQCLKVEAENSVLRAQIMELDQRLQSLREIIDFMNTRGGEIDADQGWIGNVYDHGFINPWKNLSFLNQPIVASADIFEY